MRARLPKVTRILAQIGRDNATIRPVIVHVRQLAEVSSARPGIHQNPAVDLLWRSRQAEGKNDAPVAIDANGRACWPVSHSMMSVKYDFTTDGNLRDRYLNPWGKLRIGKLLEDLDALAGSVALEHCRQGDGRLPGPHVALVTASVDRIKLLREYESVDVDMTLTGRVIFTGASSMEVLLTAQCEGYPYPFAEATFTFVARDTRPTPGTPQSDDEKAMFAAAEAKVKQRKALKSDGSVGVEGHKRLTEDMLREAEVFIRMPCIPRVPSPDTGIPVLLHSTRLSNSMICQPQQRNTAGRVFGGFLMRRAFELAFATAYVFCGRLPMFTEVDEVSFRHPVEVGSLLQLDSSVLFTSSNAGPHRDAPLSTGRQHLYVEVVARVTVPERASTAVSNTFHFSFSVGGSDGTVPLLPRILPEDSEQAQRMVARMTAEALQHTSERAVM